MTILERISAARASLRDLSDRRALIKDATLFETRATQFADPGIKLHELSALHDVLVENGIEIISVDRQWASQLRNRISALLASFVDSPTAILNPTPNEDARFALFQPLKNFVPSVEDGLLKSWQEWVERQMPPITDEILNVLSGVPALRSTGAQIQDMRRRVSRWAASLPPSTDTISAVASTCEQIGEEWKVLSGGGVPTEVVAFLRAAGLGGAPYAMLTPVTESWLREHQLIDSLKIRLS